MPKEGLDKWGDAISASFGPIPGDSPAEIRLGMARVVRERGPSVRVPWGEDVHHGQEHNPQVKTETPVAEVVQIMFHTLCYGCVAPPTIDLRPTCHADLQIMADVVGRDVLEELLHEKGPLGPRTDHTHLAF